MITNKHGKLFIKEASVEKKAGLSGEELDGAQLVKYDPETGLTFVWHGGDTINIYDDESGTEVDVFSMQSPTRERVIEGIKDHLEYMREQNG